MRPCCCASLVSLLFTCSFHSEALIYEYWTLFANPGVTAEAQHVILAEPLIAPAVEAQAIGRVHRLGQVRHSLTAWSPLSDAVTTS